MAKRLTQILCLASFFVMTIGCRSSKDDAKEQANDQASPIATSSTPQLDYVVLEGAHQRFS